VVYQVFDWENGDVLYSLETYTIPLLLQMDRTGVVSIPALLI